MRRVLQVGLAVLAIGCFETSDKGSDTGSSDGDGADGGSDGADGVGDGADGTGAGIDCDADYGTPPPDNGCVTATMSCGDSQIFDMAGAGSSRLDGRAYSSGGWACWPVTAGDYQGGERFIRFDHPGREDAPAVATIILESPCADLDLFAFWWESNSCPSSGAAPGECEADVDPGGGAVEIWNNSPRSYLIGVEAADGSEGPFRVTIQCEQ